jgi:hypothetical protein
MAGWRAIEITDEKTVLLGSGSEEQARAAFDTATRRGTRGRIQLIDERGLAVDEFAADQRAGTMTGLPIREVIAPLPPSYADAAERAKNMPFILKCMVPKGQPPEEPVELPEQVERAVVDAGPRVTWWRHPLFALAIMLVGFLVAWLLSSLGC